MVGKRLVSQNDHPEMDDPVHEVLGKNRRATCVLACSFQKVIRALAFNGRKKIRPFILCQTSWYSLIASSVSFNLI